MRCLRRHLRVGGAGGSLQLSDFVTCSMRAASEDEFMCSGINPCLEKDYGCSFRYEYIYLLGTDLLRNGQSHGLSVAHD